jgi:5-methylcytosine-specific restriction enzyme A
MAIQRTRPAWQGSNRRERLPDDWDERRAEAHRRNPQHICHMCGLPGGSDLDHIRRGDDHRQENLDWIHSRRDYDEGRSKTNCHGRKTGAEGAAARQPLNRPADVHPALR